MFRPPTAAFPAELEVLVEVARWGFVKLRENGSVDFISPLPCPFNYGSVPGSAAADGDREDVVLLGPRVAAGSQLRARVVGRVQFIDAGLPDQKWICTATRMSVAERWSVVAFFRVYARAKRALNAARGLAGPTRYAGLELPPPG
jgi:inorganic pyrophosphatase